MEIQLKLIGIILIALALVHAIFPAYFNWKRELQSLSMINREVMYVHTLFIALVIFLMGLMCLFESAAIVKTRFGKTIALGLGIFWLVRLLVQFFGYSSKLWIGKRFETGVHILFSILWLYLTIVFFAIFIS